MVQLNASVRLAAAKQVRAYDESQAGALLTTLEKTLGTKYTTKQHKDYQEVKWTGPDWEASLTLNTLAGRLLFGFHSTRRYPKVTFGGAKLRHGDKNENPIKDIKRSAIAYLDIYDGRLSDSVTEVLKKFAALKL